MITLGINESSGLNIVCLLFISNVTAHILAYTRAANFPLKVGELFLPPFFACHHSGECWWGVGQRDSLSGAALGGTFWAAVGGGGEKTTLHRQESLHPWNWSCGSKYMIVMLVSNLFVSCLAYIYEIGW